MNKEEIYDEQISPLMRRIIEVCKEHGIAMMADFAIPTEEDEGLRCTTLLPDQTGENDPLHRDCNAHISRGGRATPMMLTTEHGDGSKTFTAII